MDEGSTKTCSTCAKVKPLANFTRDARVTDGHSRRCRPCQSVVRKAYRDILRETGPLHVGRRLADQRGCDVADCDQIHYGLGWCVEHHRNWRDRGDPLAYPVRVNGGTCAAGDCEERATSRGWCQSHYGLWRSHGDPLIRKRTAPKNDGRCSFEGCPDEPTSGTAKYCVKHYKRWRKHGDPAVVTIDRAKYSRCQYCSEPSGGMKVCSRQCSSRYYKGIEKFANCRICGTQFPTWSHSKYCSDTCRLEAKREFGRRTARNAPIENPNYWDNTRRHMHNRRARKLAAFVESISPIEIHERDNWMCGICGDPIDPDARWPGPWSATIDHKIPLARGGLHKKSNVQSAHLRCNLSKHDRLPSDLAS